MKWRLFSLLFVLLAFSSCRNAKPTTGRDNAALIIPRSQWAANDPRPFARHVPVRITVHHEGTRLEAADDAAKKIKAIQVWGMGQDRNWADIPYHFLIAPNGKIYEGRDPFTVGETATEYNPAGHLLITCLGNLDVQEVPAAQLASLVQLIAQVSKKYNIPYETLSTHRDNSTQTNCPGKNLYRYFENGYVKAEVRKRLQ